MEINQLKTVPVQAKTLRMCLKVRDEFVADILDGNGRVLGGQEDGYVPDFMPGKHYGDYVMLDIDIDTGVVTNWETPDAESIQKFINGKPHLIVENCEPEEELEDRYDRELDEESSRNGYY